MFMDDDNLIIPNEHCPTGMKLLQADLFFGIQRNHQVRETNIYTIIDDYF